MKYVDRERPYGIHSVTRMLVLVVYGHCSTLPPRKGCYSDLRELLTALAPSRTAQLESIFHYSTIHRQQAVMTHKQKVKPQE
jgi:hypothetical protein